MNLSLLTQHSKNLKGLTIIYTCFQNEEFDKVSYQYQIQLDFRQNQKSNILTNQTNHDLPGIAIFHFCDDVIPCSTYTIEYNFRYKMCEGEIKTLWAKWFGMRKYVGVYLLHYCQGRKTIPEISGKESLQKCRIFLIIDIS